MTSQDLDENGFTWRLFPLNRRFTRKYSPTSGFPGGSDGIESASNVEGLGSISWLGEIPWGRARQPTAVILLGKSHGQRSQAGYSPWGHEELDMTEQLTHNQHMLKNKQENEFLFSLNTQGIQGGEQMVALICVDQFLPDSRAKGTKCVRAN